MAWYSTTGAPQANMDSNASAPITQDVAQFVGHPMYAEEYDVDGDLSVTNSDRVGGREAYELYDGLRLIGKDIDTSGLADNKFLKYDAGNSKWVLTDATGTANLADLADVEDGSPSSQDMLFWGGTEWQFLSGISTSQLSSPMGSPLTIGTTDSDGELRIEGGSTSAKILSFGKDVSGTYTEQFHIQVNDTELQIEGAGGNGALKVDNGSGLVTIPIITIEGRTLTSTNAHEGGIVYDTDTDEWFVSGDWDSPPPPN
ncbi:MAG: hypothetical protein CMB80_12415 [Flammeovirgaceae bacterium]|nr:hypothetical protein [Flammeovirgaceae bacterium]